MFTMKIFLRTTALSVSYLHKNGRKCITTTASNADKKPYPLDGIRVLDLTRIGKLRFRIDFLLYLCEFMTI